MYAMRRTTVFLEDELLKLARRFAARQGKSFAQLVRESLVAYMRQEETMKKRLPHLTGQFVSGEPDVSERVDQLLWKDPHR
jgi:hypothetical protein